jgi:hypothetical protein
MMSYNFFHDINDELLRIVSKQMKESSKFKRDEDEENEEEKGQSPENQQPQFVSKTEVERKYDESEEQIPDQPAIGSHQTQDEAEEEVNENVVAVIPFLQDQTKKLIPPKYAYQKPETVVIFETFCPKIIGGCGHAFVTLKDRANTSTRIACSKCDTKFNAVPTYGCEREILNSDFEKLKQQGQVKITALHPVAYRAERIPTMFLFESSCPIFEGGCGKLVLVCKPTPHSTSITAQCPHCAKTDVSFVFRGSALQVRCDDLLIHFLESHKFFAPNCDKLIRLIENKTKD